MALILDAVPVVVVVALPAAAFLYLPVLESLEVVAPCHGVIVLSPFPFLCLC